MPPSPDGVLDAVLGLADELYAFHELLTNPKVASFRLVTTPESMVVSETSRVWSYLALFGYGVDSVVVNRVVPQGTTDPWLDQVRGAQAPHLAEIERRFDGLHRWHAPIRAAEVTGLDRLRDFGLEMYADLDPLAAPSIAPGRVEEPASDPESLILALPLPGVAQEDVRLARSGEVVLVTVGPHRRSLTLPPHLRHRVATGARITDGQLEVEFAR